MACEVVKAKTHSIPLSPPTLRPLGLGFGGEDEGKRHIWLSPISRCPRDNILKQHFAFVRHSSGRFLGLRGGGN